MKIKMSIQNCKWPTALYFWKISQSRTCSAAFIVEIVHAQQHLKHISLCWIYSRHVIGAFPTKPHCGLALAPSSSRCLFPIPCGFPICFVWIFLQELDPVMWFNMFLVDNSVYICLSSPTPLQRQCTIQQNLVLNISYWAVQRHGTQNMIIDAVC